MREVQRDLARAESLMKIERADQVCEAYSALVAKTRRVAGDYIRASWEQDPITEDRFMNVSMTAICWSQRGGCRRQVVPTRGGPVWSDEVVGGSEPLCGRRPVASWRGERRGRG